MLKDGYPIQLQAKAFDLLLVLLENPGRVVEKDELMNRVWHGQAVEEANLTVHMSALRKALGERAGEHRYIVTVPGRGYQWAGGPAPAASTGGDDASVTDSRILDRVIWRVVIAVAAVLIMAGLFVAGGRVLRPHSRITSIAVLPFRPLVANMPDESLELGLADVLATRLGNIKELVVRPTSAIRKYARADQDPLRAGRELGVGAVVEGTIHRSGNTIRVTARLLRVADGGSLWAGEFDEQFASAFQVEDSIAEHVARALQVQLSGDESARLSHHTTESGDAYWLYLAGRYEWNKLTPEGWSRSIDLFQRAIAADPRFALAYSGLADAYMSLGADSQPAADVMGKAKQAAMKALELDQALAEAHISLARVLAFYDWNWNGAAREFSLAIALRPNSADAHREYGLYLATVGRAREAIDETTRAQNLDPFSPVTSFAVGWALTGAREYDRVIAHFQKALLIDPGFIAAHHFIGLGYVGKRMYGSAVTEFREALELSQERLLIQAELGFAEGAAGNAPEARRILSELLAQSRTRYVSPYYYAVIYAGLGDNDASVAALEDAYRDRSRRLWALGVVPTWDRLRSDPRFDSLLNRIGLPRR